MRRSQRTPKPTDRAKQFLSKQVNLVAQKKTSPRNGAPPNNIPTTTTSSTVNYQDHPPRGATIRVRWNLRDRFVWWKASVLSVDQRVQSEAETSSFSNVRYGEIKYSPMLNYASEKETVAFVLCRETNTRFVASLLSDKLIVDNRVSSWVFDDEHRQDFEKTSTIGQAEQEPNTSSTSSSDCPFDVISTRSSPNRTTQAPKTKGRVIQKSHRPKSRVLSPKQRRSPCLGYSTHVDETSLDSTGMPHELICSPIPSVGAQTLPADTHRRSPIHNETGVEDTLVSPHLVRGTTMPSHPVQSTVFEVYKLKRKLHLLEKNLHELSRSSGSQVLSSTSSSVLLSLKWSLLKRLEKPLKLLNLTDLGTHGVASHSIQVKCDCTYSSFLEVAISLARRHGVTAESGSTSRLRFIPDFDTTQCRSLAIENLYISFSNLADIAHLLGLRDDDDYEKILTKETITPTSHFTQIAGCLNIEDFTTHSGDTVSDNSMDRVSVVNVSTNRALRVYVGCIAHKIPQANSSAYCHTSSDKGRSSTGSPAFTSRPPSAETLSSDCFPSFILEQRCNHFSVQKAAYQTLWHAREMKLPLTWPPQSDDEDVSPPDSSSVFYLHWSRTKHPSTTKWSRDSYTSGTLSPGQLTLSIPAVFTKSSHTGSAVSGFFDKNIYTIMRSRWQVYRSDKRTHNSEALT